MPPISFTFAINFFIMKRFSLLVSTLFIFLTAYTQTGEVKGRVTGSNNEGIAYVNIALQNSMGTFTDDDGYFVINNVPFGKYTLAVSSIGYDGYVSEEFSVSSTNSTVKLDHIELVERSVQIAEITITEQQKVYDTRYAGTNNVISAKTLQKIQPIGTEEVIKTIPGVNIAGDQGISNRPNISIRGSDPRRSNKILLLEDGSPISPAPYLAPGAYYNPPADRLDGIQVIKGPDVLLYGANNIFGVVNYITKRPPQNPTLNLKVSGGQRGYFSGLASYGGTWNESGAELVGLFKKFDGDQDNSGLHIFSVAV